MEAGKEETEIGNKGTRTGHHCLLKKIPQMVSVNFSDSYLISLLHISAIPVVLYMYCS